MYVRASFATGSIYHVYNRGVAKQILFHNEHDYRHFLETLAFYLETKPQQRFSKTSIDDRRKILGQEPTRPLVEILAYCLMPNHFHLILKQLVDKGVSRYMQQCQNSYSRAYNTKYRRIGTAFQGVFSAVTVENDEQFLHLTRYIHLNPYVGRLAEHPEDYPWSSYQSYLTRHQTRLCHPGLALSIVGSPELYQSFVEDYVSYARDIGLIKKAVIEQE